jgi:hypothetical protein
MWSFRVASGSSTDLLMRDAQRAGSALACAFSSSDEFEAAVIRARRAEGAYGPSERQRRAYWGCAVGVVIVLAAVII